MLSRQTAFLYIYISIYICEAVHSVPLTGSWTHWCGSGRLLQDTLTGRDVADQTTNSPNERNNRLEVVIQNRLTRSETHLLKCFYFRAEMKMRQKWQNIKNIQRQQYGNVAVLSVKYTFTLIYLGFGLLVSQQSIEMCHFAHWKLEMDVSLSFLTDKHPSAPPVIFHRFIFHYI